MASLAGLAFILTGCGGGQAGAPAINDGIEPKTIQSEHRPDAHFSAEKVNEDREEAKKRDPIIHTSDRDEAGKGMRNKDSSPDPILLEERTVLLTVPSKRKLFDPKNSWMGVHAAKSLLAPDKIRPIIHFSVTWPYRSGAGEGHQEAGKGPPRAVDIEVWANSHLVGEVSAEENSGTHYSVPLTDNENNACWLFYGAVDHSHSKLEARIKITATYQTKTEQGLAAEPLCLPQIEALQFLLEPDEISRVTQQTREETNSLCTRLQDLSAASMSVLDAFGCQDGRSELAWQLDGCAALLAGDRGPDDDPAHAVVFRNRLTRLTESCDGLSFGRGLPTMNLESGRFSRQQSQSQVVRQKLCESIDREMALRSITKIPFNLDHRRVQN